MAAITGVAMEVIVMVATTEAVRTEVATTGVVITAAIVMAATTRPATHQAITHRDTALPTVTAMARHTAVMAMVVTGPHTVGADIN